MRGFTLPRFFSVPRMLVSLPLAILAACTLIGINEVSYQRSMEAVQSITHAQRARAALNTMLQQLLDAETGQRGYLLTGEAKYLQPYEVAAADLGRSLDNLRALYAEKPDALRAFSELASHVTRKQSELDMTVKLRQQGNEDAWRFVLLTDVGIEQMNATRTLVAKLISATTLQMEAGQAEITHTLQLSRIAIAIVALVGLLAFYRYLQQTTALKSAGQREQESLQRERDQLERQVLERTERLGALATHLQHVREEERGHLARELHDELGSLLTAAKLDVTRLRSKLVNATPDAIERLQHLTTTLNGGIALSRRIIEDLRPSSLSNLGLQASIEILAREFEERSGVTVAVDIEAVDMPSATQLTIYRLVQESLTNIGKYAQAQQVTVSLQDFSSHISITVVDDGKGFAPDRIQPSSHGLAGMRHRVEAAGGRLTIVSAEGQGTRIAAALPKAPWRT